MRIKELVSESTFAIAESKLIDRFKELDIEDSAQYFIDWIYHGRFKLAYSQLDKFEAAFYLIRSVLPDEIIESYDKLPTMYRGMSFSPSEIRKIYREGLPIKSRVMSWTPHLGVAIDYARYEGTGVVLEHNPRAEEVIISLTPKTEKFLGVNKFIVSNPDETILSLPLLTITPEIVERVV